ncbi:MATE family efflux transporter [Xylanimonas oleitrophica]|uniref:MATE family efflux transporter n=1 Tax=Xylanimonas oleitrophica TaxID=2607479 RepID=UPI001C54D88B|nr:MATE family efflux transporter [Xylanimonas oleitrophica]
MKNLTAGPPTRLIVAFTLPLLIGNVFQQVYMFTDAAVVGRLVGLEGLAAVGASGSVVFLLVGFSWGASAGLAIPVARAFGAGDMAGVRRYTAAGAYASLGMAVVITVLGVAFAGDILRLLDTPPELMADATRFLEVTFLGSFTTVAYNFLASTIRALGDSRTPLVFLVISCLLNAVLVVVLVGGTGWGVPGAAAATVFAQLAAVAGCVVYVLLRMPALRLSRDDWRAGLRAMGEPLHAGLPMGFQMSVIAIGALVLQLAVNGLGAVSVAAFTAAMRVDQLALAPLNSFGVAMVTYVAQNRGAQEWRRIRVGAFRASLVAGGLAVLLGGVLVLFGGPVAGLFVGPGQEEVVALAHQYFLVNGGLYAVLAVLFVLRNTVQGLGLSTVPTVAGLVELVMRSVAALVLVEHVGFLGVAMAAPLAWFGGLAPVAVAWARQRRLLLERERDDAGRAASVEGGPGVAAPGVAPRVSEAAEALDDAGEAADAPPVAPQPAGLLATEPATGSAPVA